MIARPALDPPLDPSPDQGRELLRRELLDPDYASDNLVGRLVDALWLTLVRLMDAASQAPPLTTLFAMLIGLALVLVLAWLLARARRTTIRTPAAGPVLPEEAIDAGTWRRRAEQAASEGRWSDAVVDGFRALAAAEVERGRLPDAPGTTAHEVAEQLGSARPDTAERAIEAARVFDLVLYGDRPATQEQARLVLGLDQALAAGR